MMTIREAYAESLKEKHVGLQLLIEFLVFEKKVLTLSDDADKILFYLQEKFISKMNAHLVAFENKKNGREAI
jgi:hypothetical protein